MMNARERLEELEKRKRRKRATESTLEESSFRDPNILQNNDHAHLDNLLVNENLDIGFEEEVIADTIETIEFDLGLTNRENFSIWDNDDYNYQKNREHIYYCPMYRKMQCKAKVRVTEILPDQKKARGYFQKPEDAVHKHFSDVSEKIAQMKRMEIKEKVRMNPRIAPSDAITGGRHRISDDTFVTMGSNDAMRQMIKREKNKLVGNIDTDDVMAIQFKDEILEKDGASILLYDSRTVRKDEKDVVLVFSHPETLNILKTQKYWHIDGTFKVAPKLWSQVFVIGASVRSRMIVCAQALLPGKSERYYSEVFGVLKKAIAPLMPERVLTDFEQAEICAIRANFALAIITLCFFHFCQSMYRRFSELHLPKKFFKDDTPWSNPLLIRAKIPVDTVGKAAKRSFRAILSLPYIPPHLVRRAFSLIVETSPPGLEEFFFYLCKNYIGLIEEEKILGSKAYNGADITRIIQNEDQVQSSVTMTSYSSNLPINSSVQATTSQDHQYQEDLNQSGPNTSIISFTNGAQLDLSTSTRIPRWDAEIRYAPRYEIKLWNVHDRAKIALQLTNNSLEASHKHFSRRLCHHPSLSDFVATYKDDISKQLDRYRSLRMLKADKRNAKAVLKENDIMDILKTAKYDTDEQILDNLYQIGLQFIGLVRELHKEHEVNNDKENEATEEGSSLQDDMLNVTD